MERALDVSNYSGSFGGEVVECWRAHGYGHLICGTQRPEITRSQLAAASGGGLSVSAYVYLYWRFDVVEQVRQALSLIEGFPIERLWLDCEDAPAGRSAEDMVALIGAAVAACGTVPCGIYTGRWWWPAATGNSRGFAHLPLWHAEYTSSAEQLPNFDGFKPYGGWTRPSVWQYQGTTSLCGVSVDLNLRDVVVPAPPPSLPALTAEERWELEVLRAGRRFEQALHSGRFALRPAQGRPNAVELVRVDGAAWRALEPPCVLVVE